MKSKEQYISSVYKAAREPIYRIGSACAGSDPLGSQILEYEAREHGAFSTSDLNVAGYVVARGHPLLGVRVEDGRCKFVFAKDVEPSANAYKLNAPIPARQFAAALRDLKSLVHDAMRNPSKTILLERAND